MHQDVASSVFRGSRLVSSELDFALAPLQFHAAATCAADCSPRKLNSIFSSRSRRRKELCHFSPKDEREETASDMLKPLVKIFP